MSWRVLIITVLVMACSGPSGDGTTTPTQPDTTTSVVELTTTTEPATTTTQAGPTSTVHAVDVEISGGEVTGPDRIEVRRGDEVMVTVLSDTDEVVHVHGFDLFFEVSAGTPHPISFVADLLGVFEVEAESDHLLLFELVVEG